MGFYDGNSLYIPSNFEELELQFYNRYIQEFNIDSIEAMRQSNVYLKVIKPVLLYETQQEIAMGALYDNLIQYLKNYGDEVKIFGSSLEGVTNALSSLEFITAINLSDSNIDSTLDSGQVHIALQYPDTVENNIIIADTLLNNAAAGIEFLGDIEITTATTVTGQSFIFRWSEFTEKILKVDLTVVYDATFSGQKLTFTEIEDVWFEKFTENYLAGKDIVPYFYNSGITSLSSVSSVFTIDDVAQPPDTTIVGVYNVLYLLDRADVVAHE